MVNNSLGRIDLDIGPVLGDDWATALSQHMECIIDPSGDVCETYELCINNEKLCIKIT